MLPTIIPTNAGAKNLMAYRLVQERLVVDTTLAVSELFLLILQYLTLLLLNHNLNLLSLILPLLLVALENG